MITCQIESSIRNGILQILLKFFSVFNRYSKPFCTLENNKCKYGRQHKCSICTKPGCRALNHNSQPRAEANLSSSTGDSNDDSVLVNKIIIVKTVHACLTSKFLVQPLNAECGGLETTYKDSRQMFQHSDRMFEQIFQISFKISFGT